MRTVFKNHGEVCHVWASRSQNHGRYGNINFEGDSIYSYGWWEMARLFITKSGKKYVIMRNWTYSSSTGKHMSHVRGALRGDDWTYIGVCGYKGNLIHHESNLADIIADMKVNFSKIKTSHYPENHIRNTISSYENMKLYCRLFKLKVPKEAKDYIGSFDDAKYLIERRKAEREEREKKREQREIERNERRAKELEEEIKESQTYEERWMNGENVPTWHYVKDERGYWYQESFDTTRLRIKNDYVETSRHATVPVREGKMLWERIKAGKDVKGWKVGSYTVIAMNGELQIGCHHISREEIDRFVNKYNW